MVSLPEKEPRILIVEENEYHGLLMERQIAQRLNGSLVVLTPSPDEALGFIRSHQFDVAVVDFALEDCDGLSFLRSLHQISPDLAIIVIAEDLTEAITKEIFRCGCRELLIKDSSYYAVIPRMVAGLFQRGRIGARRRTPERQSEPVGGNSFRECLRHDLRSPINVIIEMSRQIIAGADDDEPLRAKMSAIEKSALSMKSSLESLAPPSGSGCPTTDSMGGTDEIRVRLKRKSPV